MIFPIADLLRGKGGWVFPKALSIALTLLPLQRRVKVLLTPMGVESSQFSALLDMDFYGNRVRPRVSAFEKSHLVWLSEAKREKGSKKV